MTGQRKRGFAAMGPQQQREIARRLKNVRCASGPDIQMSTGAVSAMRRKWASLSSRAVATGSRSAVTCVGAAVFLEGRALNADAEARR